MVLIMEWDYGIMLGLLVQNPHNNFPGTSDTVTEHFNVELTTDESLFLHKWRAIFSVFRMLGPSRDKHDKVEIGLGYYKGSVALLGVTCTVINRG